MHWIIDIWQVVYAFCFALAVAIFLPPRGFGFWKRAIGFAALFAAFVGYAIAENNLQVMRAEYAAGYDCAGGAPRGC